MQNRIIEINFTFSVFYKVKLMLLSMLKAVFHIVESGFFVSTEFPQKRRDSEGDMHTFCTWLGYDLSL